MEQKDTRAGLTFVGFRANRRQKEKLSRLISETGLSQSAVLRALVDQSDTVPFLAKPILRPMDIGEAVQR